MLQNFTYALPLRDYSDHDLLQFYSLNGTGMGGLFVIAETGNQNPVLTAGRYTNTSVGAAYEGTTSLRYENPRKVRLAGSGDNQYKVLGLMLFGTVETDGNGQRLILNPNLAKEIGCVYSGQTTPIASAGYFRLQFGASTGIPIPGFVGIIHNTQPGKIAYVDSANVSDKSLIVCKVLSSSGSAFGGYADVQLTLG